MSIWSSIFGPRPGAANPIDIRPSGLLIDADGWFYEESLDSQCPLRTIRIQQDRPGDWYVRNTNCSIAELNDPARAAEVLEFFTGSFRWLKFEREAENGRSPDAIRIIGTFLDGDGVECASILGYVEPSVATALVDQDVDRLWGRIRCIRPPGSGRRPNFCLRYDILVELDEKLFGDDLTLDARLDDFLPVVP
jgi:hypothetical protein